MTAMLSKTVTNDLEWVEAGIAGVDPESDVGFFSMSPASAEQVTVQIRNVLDRAWEFIALAYKGRAFLALGYGSWDEYVDARFGDMRLAVPREHRSQVVATLAGARMSVRAIAKLLGVGVATVHREMVRATGLAPGTSGELDMPVSSLGRDGKSYPRDRRAVPKTCPTCGEVHAVGPSNCPWDLFARGLGPHPGGGVWDGMANPEDLAGTSVTGIKSKNRQVSRKTKKIGKPHDVESTPVERVVSRGASFANVDAVNRLECLMQEMGQFAGLVNALEIYSKVEPSTGSGDEQVAVRIRKLTQVLRNEIAGWPDLVDRLTRVANKLRN